MIGTQENGTRVLFCQSIKKEKYGTPYISDYRPDWYSYDGTNAFYVELRNHGVDYVLEMMSVNNGSCSKSFVVMNDDQESEFEKVRKAIALFDQYVCSHPELTTQEQLPDPF